LANGSKLNPIEMKKINWNEVSQEQVNPKMKRKFIYGEKMMVAKMEFEDGFTVPWHQHENEQITEVIEGTLRFWFDNNEDQHIDLHAGDSIIIPGNRPHKALMIGRVIETDTFAPPRQDWINSSDDYLRK
jgi:quercetin dioxygenase-like cupin family protein